MIEQLLARFRHTQSDYNKLYLRKFKALSVAQSPIAAMISCSDARLEPARLFSLNPGDLYSIRNLANLVPDCSTVIHPCETVAGLEFAVTKLNVPHLVVLGHSQCAGIRRMMDLTDSSSKDNFTDEWLRQAKDICRLGTGLSLGEDLESKTCEQLSISVSISRLMTYPWISKLVDRRSLSIHGWYYSLSEGQLFCLDPKNLCFNLVH